MTRSSSGRESSGGGRRRKDGSPRNVGSVKNGGDVVMSDRIMIVLEDGLDYFISELIH